MVGATDRSKPDALGNGGFTPGKPRVWIASLSGATGWDLAPDGKRVVALIPESTVKTPPPEHEIVMLQNFADELRRRVPIGK